MSCKYQCKECNCSNIPLERITKKPVDIFFITEFPGKAEAKAKKFLIQGRFFREILSKLHTKTNFTYAISAVTRSISSPGILVHHSHVVQACLPNLKAEIEKCQPRSIIFLGDLPYTIFSKNHHLPKYGPRVEDGRLFAMNIFGKKYPVMYCQHPTWYLKNEACAVGFMYENIQRMLDYLNSFFNPNIPNTFTSVTLKTLKDVKKVLDDMKNTDEYVAVDTEDINLNRVYDNKILSIQLSNDGKVGYMIPYLHKDSPFTGKKLEKLNELLLDFFYDSKTKVRGYIFVNAKYDYHQFFHTFHRFTFNAPVIDASFAQYSLEENWVRVHSFPKGKGPYSLFTMAYKRGFKFYADTDSKEKRTILDKLPMNEWEQYAAADVVAPWHIFKKQMEEAKYANYYKGFMFLNHLYENHVVRILTYAEHCGLSINADKVRELSDSSSTIKVALKEIMDKWYSLPTVQEANRILTKNKTGIVSGLAGQVRTWSPTSPVHRELLYFKIMGLDPVTEEDDEDNAHTGKNFQKAYFGTPEVDLLADFMSFDKMMSGFIKPMSGYLDKNSPKGEVDMYSDSRARTSFFPLAVTGRTRSANPNTQQRPAGRSKAAKEILSMYQPKKGRVVVKLDYKTFEVMGSGFLSKDKVMIKSFREMHELKETFRAHPTKFAQKGYDVERKALKETYKGLKKRKGELLDSKKVLSKADYAKAKEDFKNAVIEYKEKLKVLEERKDKDPMGLALDYVTLMTDSHRKFASLFFKTMVTNVTKQQRQSAKSLVFGLIYGMSLASIAKTLKITEDEAQKLYDTYMASFPYAAKWLANSKKFGQRNYYVESPLGRRRHLWGHLRCEKGVSGKMDRYAGNTVIQGFCSDSNLTAGSIAVQVFEAHNKLKYQTDKCWETTNLIHDSNEFEVPLEDTYYFIREIEKVFTDYLRMYFKAVFGFSIEIPIEVDFTIGTNYGNTRDWNGSEEDLIDGLKWLCEETAKRDGTKVMDYKKIVNSPLYKKYPKGFVLEIVKSIIDRDVKYAKRLGLHK